MQHISAKSTVSSAPQAGILHHLAPLVIVVAFGIVGIGLLVSSHAATPPVSSEPADPVYASNGQIMRSNVTAGKIGTSYYKNWSGYAATGKTFTKVYGALVVPTVHCSKFNAGVLFWVGFDGFALTKNQTVEQAGIGAQCSAVGKAPNYFAFWSMHVSKGDVVHDIPAKKLAVAPGQKVDETVAYNLDGTYTLALKNLATKQQFTTKQSCPKGYSCKRQSAEWIAERPYAGGYAPLAPWGTMQFTNIQASTRANKALQAAGSFSYSAIDMLVDGSLDSQVTRLQSGKAFTDTSLAYVPSP